MAGKFRNWQSSRRSGVQSQSEVRAGQKRWKKALKRRGKSYEGQKIDGLDAPPVTNAPVAAIADRFSNDRSANWVDPALRSLSGEILIRNFSFIDKPEETLRNIKKIIEADCTHKEYKLDLCDEYCWDMGPYVALALLWDELSSGAFVAGKYTPAIRKALVATGLDKLLKMNHQDPDAKDTTNVWPIRIMECRNTPGSPNEGLASGSSKVAQRFVDKMGEWLAEVGFMLTPAGDDYLLRMISEILENGIIHSEPETRDGTAYLAGFMARRSDPDGGDERYVCHITVLSLGADIFDSMQTCSVEIREQIIDLVEKHKRGFRLRPRWTRKALWTLYALQDGVTRIENQPGGRGFMDMVEFFGTLGRSEDKRYLPKMAIVSGNVVVHLEGQMPGKVGKVRVLALNDDNDLQKAPDTGYIWNMKRERFPGTVLSLRFFLNPQFLAELVRQDGERK